MTTVVRQLRAWQTIEFSYLVTRAVAILLAIVVFCLTIACITDWLCDRYQDTPMWVRALLSGGQLVIYSFCGWLMFRTLRRPSIDILASRAEAAYPDLDHRLVTAIQLNRPTAKTEGMSKLLISVVTTEADQIASKLSLTKLVDARPLKWAAAILAPLALFVALIVLLNPTLAMALVQRQFLLPVEIPRSIQVENATPELLPAGDPVELVIRVKGPVDEATKATVLVTPEGQPTEVYEARFVSRFEDGTARYVASLPPASEPFRFTARIQNGRMHKPAKISFDSRPVVSNPIAWTLLPAYVDPEGKRRYERLQVQGEVMAHADASVRVRADISKIVTSARISVLGREENGTEKVLYSAPMTITPSVRIDQPKTLNEKSVDISTVEHTFDLTPLVRPTRYRIEVTDAHGFSNLTPPSRGITIAPDDPPIVKLLDELFAVPKLIPGKSVAEQIEDYEARGFPLTLGGKVLMGYRASSALGIKSAAIVFRINDGEWTRLPLAPTTAKIEKVGNFVPELGLFANSDIDGGVELYLIPAANPDEDPNGLEAGGRYNFLTDKISKRGADGKLSKLELGDRIELYVEVYDRKPSAKGGQARLPGKSESRMKTVVTNAALQEWILVHTQGKERLKRIEEAQKGVYK